jgi:hypothetical protein
LTSHVGYSTGTASASAKSSKLAKPRADARRKRTTETVDEVWPDGPVRRHDADIKMWLCRGYSEEAARELAAQAPSVPSYWATRYGGEIV